MEKNTDTKSIRNVILTVLSVCLVLFHLYTASFGILSGYIQAPIHWAFVGSIIIIAKPSKSRIGKIWDILVIALTVFLAVYQIKIQNYLIFHPGRFQRFDVVVSCMAVLIALYYGFRLLGKVLPIVCIVFIVYAFIGYKIPGMFQTSKFSFQRIMTYLYTMTDGLYGSTLLVSAQYLLLFVFFGALMDATGAGEFFVDIANAVAGRVRGGPAQASVYSSMLMGMVNGSGAANVATTGTFTIPLMKKTGYSASMAGAVEAVASSGGQIMPPVMGAVAFLMSEITGIPYVTIALSAFVPAVLYYVSLSVSIYGVARRLKMEKVDPASLPKPLPTLKKGWFYLVPLLIIIVMIFSGKSAQRSVFWAIVSSVAVTLLFKRKEFSLKKFAVSCVNAAVSCAPLALCCMLAGIVMGMINLTGLGLKITSIIQALSGNSLLISLLLAMITSLLLGMGLPTSAAYVVLAVLIVPSLTNMGVSVIGAHLFILYFGALSSITPPVALSTFTAAGISGAGIWQTGWDAIKLSAAGFLLPFIFAYSDELFLAGEPLMIVVAVVTAVLGCSILGFSVSGWAFCDLPVLVRILLLPCCIMVIVVRPLWVNVLGLALAAALILYAKRVQTKNSPKIQE